MALYCSTDIRSALQELQFPASKSDVLHRAQVADATEAALVALNELPDGLIFLDIEAICENVSTACSLDMYRALEGLVFPARGEEVARHAASHEAGPVARMALSRLKLDAEYATIGEVCRAAGA